MEQNIQQEVKRYLQLEYPYYNEDVKKKIPEELSNFNYEEYPSNMRGSMSHNQAYLKPFTNLDECESVVKYLRFQVNLIQLNQYLKDFNIFNDNSHEDKLPNLEDDSYLPEEIQ